MQHDPAPPAPHRLPPPPRARRRRIVLVAAAGAAVCVLLLVVAAVAGWYPSPSTAGRPDTSSAERSAAAGTPGSDLPSPSGTGSPPGSASPSPVRSSTAPTPARPASGGKPGAGNTGVPAGTKLTVVTGDQTYRTANQVISGLDIRGFVHIAAANVTIRNSIIRGGRPRCNSAVVAVDSGSLVLQDAEVVPDSPNACLDGVWAQNTTLTRVNVHGTVDGVKAGNNVVVQDSWIHDMSWYASDPNQNGGPTHNDAVQSFVGNQHITLRHNTLAPGAKSNAAFQVTQDGGGRATDLHVEANWLDDGGCTLNFAHKGGPTPMTGIYVVGNRFGRHSTFQCPILVSTQTQLSQNSGNVWDDTGRPIPAPQRHD